MFLSFLSKTGCCNYHLSCMIYRTLEYFTVYLRLLCKQYCHNDKKEVNNYECMISWGLFMPVIVK